MSVRNIEAVTLGNSSSDLPTKVFTPSDPTGSKDVAAELEQFVTNNQGKTIRVDGVTILLNDFGNKGFLKATDDILIDFTNSTILYDEGEVSMWLDNSGNASSEVGVASVIDTTINSVSGVTQITLDSTLNAKAHDWIAIYSDDANPSRAGGKLGEIMQISEDESGLVINLTGKLGRTSLYSTNVRARLLDSTRKCQIIGGTWKANGDTDNPAITDREQALHIQGFVNARLTNLTFDAPWAQGVQVQCTAATIVDNLEIRNTLNMGNFQGFSYGVVLYGMNGSSIVKNTVARNCRHPGGTTDGNTASSTWYQLGFPTYYKFLNTAGYNCYGSIGDSHEEGMYGLWDGLWDHNPIQDANGSFVGRLFQGRAAFETVRNFASIGGCRGISFDDIDHGVLDVVVVQNGTVRNKNNSAVNAEAIYLADNTNTNKRHYKISNVEIEKVDTGIYAGRENIITLDNVKVSGSEEYAECRPGCDITVTNMVNDHRNSDAAGATYVFQCRSDVTSGGCSVRILDKPVIMKGNSSNRPSALFNEIDTNANKTVWHNGIIQYNPDGVTDILSKSSGSTTFVNATDIVEVAL